MLGDLPVGSIDNGAVMKIIEPLWREKTETAPRLGGTQARPARATATKPPEVVPRAEGAAPAGGYKRLRCAGRVAWAHDWVSDPT